MAWLIEDYGAVKSGKWSQWNLYNYRNYMKNHVLPIIGDVLVSDINVSLIREVLDPIWLIKPRMADVVLNHMSQMLEYAKFCQLRDDNPTHQMRKYMPEQPLGGHRRDMSFTDIPQFIARLHELQAGPWYLDIITDRAAVLELREAGLSYRRIAKVIGAKTNTVLYHMRREHGVLNYPKLRAYALELLILTGAPRANEMLSTQWREVDEEQAILTMARSRMKVKKRDSDHIIPLSTRALEIIRELRTVRYNDYLFPGSLKGKRDRTGRPLKTKRPHDPTANGHPTSTGGLIKFLRNECGCTDCDVHGFRKSFSNWANNSGRFREIAIELCLDHAYGSQISRIYRDDPLIEERRVLLQAWCDYCGGTPADVIQLPVRRPARRKESVA